MLRLRVISVSLLFLGWIGAVSVQSQVVINEFLAANAKGLVDQDGDTSDWIELYNRGDTGVDLQGWSLSDSTNTLSRWYLPSTNLAAKAYLVVYASGKNRAVSGKQLHTSFTLSAEGEYLGLFDSDGDVASEYAPAYPPQYTDTSYGLSGARSYYFPVPTPGTVNGTGYENFVADTKFSVDRGFFTAAFNVEITCTTVDATIRYTTNGTMPTATTGFVYAGPVRIAGTTVLRAAAFKTGFQPSNVDTQTYLFLTDVVQQSPTGAPPPGWPSSWGSNVRDYGMDPDVVNSPKFGPQMETALKSIPTMSIVMSLDDLFNSSTGIYANPGQDARAWERRCSLELVYPDGKKGFQSDAGLRIRGGYSRSTSNPKHGLRLFFREDYGAPTLKYPLFGPNGQSSIDAFDLRCSQNYSWSFEGDSRCVHLRDVFSRDTQLAMGDDAERGDFYHLYINGQYWGLYNTCERPEASYGANYYGGVKEDYDVIKVAPDNSYTLIATDGNMTAWTRLYNLAKAGLATDAAYEFIQGNNPDGTRNPAYERLLEVDNMIDYMFVIFYGGNLDAPISNFLGNTSPNNWYGIRSRVGTDGFRFYSHDAEHTLLNVNENRLGPYTAGDGSVTKSSPQWIYQKCMANAEFRMRVADRAQKFMFNRGVLTPEGAMATFMTRKTQIDTAVIAESARWGDSKRSVPLTRDDWQNAINDIVNNFFPQRTTVLLSQLRSKSLYPSIDAPMLAPASGAVQKGITVTMGATKGTIYYTTDGTDPRLRGGALSPSARAYSSGITVQESVMVRARALSGTNWSAIVDAPYTVIQTYTNLMITEIMYHPAPEGATDGDQFEFIELKNGEPFQIDLSGVRFASAINYTFPQGRKLEPGAFVVLANNATNFAKRYPGVTLDGVYTGNLANGGERITVVHATGAPLVVMDYGDAAPWPVTADGQGFSLVPVDPNANPNPADPNNWRPSSRINGSPGADDPPVGLTGLAIINEILTHTDAPELDTIELFNPGTNTVDLSGWYLTDMRVVPKKYKIQNGVTLDPGAYITFNESQFNPTPGTDPSFTLSSHGEEVFLFSADAAGNLTGYSDGFKFDAAANGVTFGRYTNSVGAIQYPPQKQRTLGGPNAGPWVGPVVINEIHYQPRAGESEFIEIKNVTEASVALFDPAFPTNTWKLAGVDFYFPANIVLPPHGILVIAGGDPAAFRAAYGVPASVRVLGPMPGALQDGGELLELKRPDGPEVDTNGVVTVPMITVDAVRYNNRAPWPTLAAGGGSSLERVDTGAWGNDPANWKASNGVPSPGLENDGNRPPITSAGLAQEIQVITLPTAVTLRGSATDDGQPKPPGALAYSWTQVSGPGRVLFETPGSNETKAWLPGLGSYVFALTASDGDLSSSAQVSVLAGRPPTQATLLPAASKWKFWDKGSEPAGNWKSLVFDETGWGSGNGPLGYGDNQPTTVSFGPNSGSKYPTTYFRSVLMVTNANLVTSLKLGTQHDDGVVVYINGTEVYRDNMPEGAVTYGTWASTAIGDETTYFEKDVDPTVLVEGKNQISVEIHQSTGNSSDISFDMIVTAQILVGNQPLVVQAGPDQSITLPAIAQLSGSFLDDGLPMPPGAVTLQWTKQQGPGTVSFADANLWQTSASFDQAGIYVLRLTASDGATQLSDDIQVEVKGGPTQPAQWDGPEFVSDPAPAIRLRFTAEPNQHYALEYRDAFPGEGWKLLKTLQGSANGGTIEVLDPLDPERPARFYRLVTIPGPL